jgi:K+-transporting ATPase KdpF subunit
MKFLLYETAIRLEILCGEVLSRMHRANREASCSTCFSLPSVLVFWARRCFTPLPATGCENHAMTLDYALGAIVTVGLLFYLAYALIRPERF